MRARHGRKSGSRRRAVQRWGRSRRLATLKGLPFLCCGTLSKDLVIEMQMASFDELPLADAEAGDKAI